MIILNQVILDVLKKNIETICLNVNQDGRVVKALDLRSNGHLSSWVRTPLLVVFNHSYTIFLWQVLSEACTIAYIIVGRTILLL